MSEGVHFPQFLEEICVGYPQGDLTTSPYLLHKLPFPNMTKYLKTMGLTIKYYITQ